MMNIKQCFHNFKGINDSTLREGEQFNQSEFSLEDQRKILNLLYSIGVDTAEVGNPIVPEIYADLSELTHIKKRPPIMAHIRNKECDLKAALDLRVDGVHILCTADSSRLKSMQISLEEHISQMVRNVQLAKDNRLVVRVSAEHGLEPEFFNDALKILKAADCLGVNRVQLADTRGVLLPWAIGEMVQKFRRVIKTQIGIHLHNDLGHAVSNAVYALAAGINWIDTTLMGIGERTGITPLSSLLINLHELDPRLVQSYDLSILAVAEQQAAKIIHTQVPHNLITSETAFSHKAGIHVNALQKQGLHVYEAINPELVGNKRVIVTDSRISGKQKNICS